MSRAVLSIAAVVFLIGSIAAQTTVKGRVTGADGKPTAMTVVAVLEPKEARAIGSARADKDGRYSLTIKPAGIWLVRFSGVGFRSHDVALCVDTPRTVTLNVRLESYRYLDDFSQANIVGDFNRWYMLSAVPLKKQADGTYAADVATKADTLAYRLNGVRVGDAVEGTQADRYVPNGSGGFVSVLNVTGRKARIVFNPRKLVRSTTPPQVTFAPAGSRQARFAAIYDDFQQATDAFTSAQQDFLRSRGRQGLFAYDWKPVLAKLVAQTADEPQGITRQELYLNYLTLASAAKAADPAVCKKALQEVPPGSNVWVLNPHAMQYALDRSGFSLEEREKYIQQVLDQNHNPKIKAAVLFNEFMVAKLNERKAAADRYSNILLKKYGDTQEAAMVKTHQ